MSKEKSQLHLAEWCGTSLILSFLLSVAGSFLPQYCPPQNMLWQGSLVLEMIGFGALAIKAVLDKSHIAAVGFTVIAISLTVFFSVIKVDSEKVDYAGGASGILFMIPSIIMISYYSLFPIWLRVAGFVVVLPFIYIMVRIYTQTYNPDSLLENIGFLLFQFITLGWAYYFWKDERKKT